MGPDLAGFRAVPSNVGFFRGSGSSPMCGNGAVVVGKVVHQGRVSDFIAHIHSVLCQGGNPLLVSTRLGDTPGRWPSESPSAGIPACGLILSAVSLQARAFQTPSCPIGTANALHPVGIISIPNHLLGR